MSLTRTKIHLVISSKGKEGWLALVVFKKLLRAILQMGLFVLNWNWKENLQQFLLKKSCFGSRSLGTIGLCMAIETRPSFTKRHWLEEWGTWLWPLKMRMDNGCMTLKLSKDILYSSFPSYILRITSLLNTTIFGAFFQWLMKIVCLSYKGL